MEMRPKRNIIIRQTARKLAIVSKNIGKSDRSTGKSNINKPRQKRCFIQIDNNNNIWSL